MTYSTALSKINVIREKLSRIKQYKSDIESAIENKGVDVEAGAPLRLYSNRIGSITGGGGGNANLKLIIQLGWQGYEGVFSNIEFIRPYALYYQDIRSASAPSCSYVGSRAFEYCSSLSTVYMPICSSVGYAAFMNCYSLSSVYLPNCVNLEAWAFINAGVQNVNINKCSEILSYTFNSCKSLSRLYAPRASYIGSYAIGYCRSLSYASFGAVTYIGSNAFYQANPLKELYITGSNCTLASTDAFSATSLYSAIKNSNYNIASIYVPYSYVNDYKTKTNWVYYSSIIQGFTPGSITGDYVIPSDTPTGEDTSDLETQLATLTAENSQLQSQLSTLQSSNSTLTAEIAQLETDIEGLENNISDLGINENTINAILGE